MMKCEKFQELILLDRYGEIDEAARRILNRHIDVCPICAAEKTRTDDIYDLLEKREEAEIDTEWLKSMRNQMIAHLQVSKRQKTAFTLDWNRLAGFFRTPALKFAYSAMLVVIGFSVGKFECQQDRSRILPQLRGGQMTAQSEQAMNQVDMETMLQEGKLRNVDLQEIDGEQIQVSFQGTKDYELVGSPEDKNIQEVLAYIMLHESNTGLRMQSLEKLSQQPDSLVQQLLIYSVLNDENDGVRLKAIRSLHTYPPSLPLRQAYMKALMTDVNSAVRIEAMEGLKRMVQDDQVRGILKIAAAKDENDYVKLLARSALNAYEEETVLQGTAIEDLNH